MAVFCIQRAWGIVVGVIMLQQAFGQPDTSWPQPVPTTGPSWWASVGNHRFEMIAAAAGPSRATIAWRRSDASPLLKEFFVTDTTGNVVSHCGVVNVTSTMVDIVFAATGAGVFFLYYEPFHTCEYTDNGACCYNAYVTYDALSHCSDGQWWSSPPVPVASVNGTDRTLFDAYTELEEPLSEVETTALVALQPGGVFGVLAAAVDRATPLRMTDAVPDQWALKPPAALTNFAGAVQRGENYTFQVGLYFWGPAVPLNVTGVVFHGFSGLLLSSPPSCLNLQGSDFWGHPYISNATLAPRSVLALWLLVPVDVAAQPGVYDGALSIELCSAAASDQLTVNVTLTVEDGDPLPDGGDSNATRGTRLAWLSSTLGLEPNAVPAPYTPIDASLSDGTFGVALLGKVITWTPASGSISLLSAITTVVGVNVTAILASPVTLSFGTLVDFEVDQMLEVSSTPQAVTWAVLGSSAQSGVSFNATVRVDCTGFLDYVVDIFAGVSDWPAPSINLTVQTNPLNAFYAMGLGRHGGLMSSVVSSGAELLMAWIIVDMGDVLTSNAFAFYSAGDTIHDTLDTLLFVALTATGPWELAAQVQGAAGQPNVQQVFSFSNGAISARFWRLVSLTRFSTNMCAPLPFCQPYIGEFQLRDAASNQWIVNNGTALHSTLVAASGAADPANAPWKAVDGNPSFVEYQEGWDAATGILPDVNVSSAAFIDWKWDGLNGNNGVWVGSSVGGLRVSLKGADPLWQAGVPFDSNASPTPPDSWSNSGRGGISLYNNGTIVGYTGTRPTLFAGDSLRLQFSLMVTPTHDVDWTKKWQLRWT